MRLVLLWFGSWKNSMSCYAPAWVKRDPQRFARATDLDGDADPDLVLAMDRWNEFSPCQNGGIVAYVHEHGTDSGCGDNNWP